MNGQACAPCSRRKVRCDKRQPCSNCKRRKQDQCTYPEVSPSDRIRKLESLVRSLGGDPESEIVEHHVSKRARLGPSPTEDIEQDAPKVDRGQPVIVQEDGQPVYLESSAWHSSIGANQRHGAGNDMMCRPLVTCTKRNVLQSIMTHHATVDLSLYDPTPKDATMLWDLFEQNVYPLVRIDFSWSLERLRTRSIDANSRNELTIAEQALVFSIYLISVASMSKEDRLQDSNESNSDLFNRIQLSCEEALLRNNILCIIDIVVLKALLLYMLACIETASTQSLWSLMGIAIRSAEKMGLQRDGQILGLNPLETEDRRRLWWQLQYLDLILGVRSGSTSLSLMAPWDTKLPLNIEDEDINTETKTPPQERKGLTSLAYNLCTAWIISEQRGFFGGKLGVSWPFLKAVPHATKHAMIDKLEDGLNSQFLQYCDLVRPLDTLIQVSMRSFIAGMRMVTLLPMAFSGDPNLADKDEHHCQLLEAAVKTLEYTIAMNSRPELQHFRWWQESYFPWHGFICILVEARQQKDASKSRKIWTLLSNLYTSSNALLHLSDDRRKSHAAELILSAWKMRYQSDPSLQKPTCVLSIENALAESRTHKVANDHVSRQMQQQQAEVLIGDGDTTQGLLAEQDLDAILNFDFSDIDWSFWAGMM